MIARIVFVCLALIALVTFADWYSAPFVPCHQIFQQSGQPGKGEQGHEEYCSTGKVVAFWRAIGRVVDAWHDDLTAISTLVIAVFTTILGIFTVSLARSTRIAANAARHSADAADLSARTTAGVELPWFVIDEVQMEVINQSIALTLRHEATAIGFKNLGRSQAIIIVACIDHHVGMTLPTTPTYAISKVRRPNTSVGHGERYDTTYSPNIPQIESAKIENDVAILWLFGYIEYLDFLGNTWRSGFSASLRPYKIGDGFWLVRGPEGPAAYTYKKQIS